MIVLYDTKEVTIFPSPYCQTPGAAAAKKSGPTIIIFVVGGLTYSEMRAAYDASAATNREVIVGKSPLITFCRVGIVLKIIIFCACYVSS